MGPTSARVRARFQRPIWKVATTAITAGAAITIHGAAGQRENRAAAANRHNAATTVTIEGMLIITSSEVTAATTVHTMIMRPSVTNLRGGSNERTDSRLVVSAAVTINAPMRTPAARSRSSF